MERYSVLITVYKNDNPSYFEAALLSMINQTVKPDEIILVKDGAIGIELQKVVDDLNRNGNIIKEIQLKKNKGLGLALNEGIKVCKNNLIARMDSDDISFLNRCEKQLLEFEKDPSLDIVGCPVIEFIDNVENQIGKRDVPKTNQEIYSYSKKRDPFNHPTVMYKKSKLEEVGMYNDLRKNQDTDLWIRMLIKNAKCKNLDKPYLYFRFDDETYRKRKNWLNTKLLIKIRWNAYRLGFNSFIDFLQISILQIGIYLMPISFQKFIYKHILRR